MTDVKGRGSLRQSRSSTANSDFLRNPRSIDQEFTTYDRESVSNLDYAIGAILRQQERSVHITRFSTRRRQSSEPVELECLHVR
jgi:hypothetical protein